MENDEHVIRFFGMKDCDGMLKVATNLTTGIFCFFFLLHFLGIVLCLLLNSVPVRVGPFTLKQKEKKNKLKDSKPKLTLEQKRHKVHAGFWKIHQVSFPLFTNFLCVKQTQHNRISIRDVSCRLAKT